MSKETEKAIREFQKFLDEHKDEIDFDELGKGGVIPFPLSQQSQKKTDMDAYDYLEMAENATSEAAAVRYAKKALAIDPTMLDADIFLARCKKDLAAIQKAMEKVLEKGKMQLEERGISFVDDAGDFYGLFETRPYMRALNEYMTILMAQGKVRKAVSVGEEGLHLNENDNMGIRYSLMLLYAYLEEAEKAEALMKRYEDEESVHMLLPLVALYYKLDDEKTAKSYLKKMCAHTKGVREAFEAIEEDEVDLDEAMMAPYYQPYSSEEIYLTYASGIFLFGTMPDFSEWVIKNCPKKRKC